MYDRLIALLDENGADYRLIDHPAEGRTEIVSGFRGHPPGAAAKCMILMLKLGKKVTRYVLAVIPGDAKVNFDSIKSLFGATYVSFAAVTAAETLAGAPTGGVLPFAMHPDLQLVVDSEIESIPELFFNAARLDRSVALKTVDYVRIAKPRFADIATRS